MKAGDRVRWKTAYDPMAAFNVEYGWTSPAGTVSEVTDGMVLVTWDSDDGEAQGSMSPHAPEELEPVP